jgi:hypothetical protein
MSKDVFTFYNYLVTNKSNEIEKFLLEFSDKIHLLPDKVVSSRQLIKLLEITSRYEFKIFQNVFNDYYIIYMLD